MYTINMKKSLKQVKALSKEDQIITVGKIKPIKMYKMDIICSDNAKATFVQLGREVITDEQLFEIGALHTIMQSIEAGTLGKKTVEKKKKKNN